LFQSNNRNRGLLTSPHLLLEHFLGKASTTAHESPCKPTEENGLSALLLLGHEAPEQAWPLVGDVAFIVGQGFLAIGANALLFVKKNGQRAKDRKVARTAGFMHLATVFVLSSISAVVLAIFNRPMIAREL